MIYDLYICFTQLYIFKGHGWPLTFNQARSSNIETYVSIYLSKHYSKFIFMNRKGQIHSVYASNIEDAILK